MFPFGGKLGKVRSRGVTWVLNERVSPPQLVLAAAQSSVLRRRRAKSLTSVAKRSAMAWWDGR